MRRGCPKHHHARQRGHQPTNQFTNRSTNRAQVLDDPKLLRKSLKKDAKRKEKSARKWEERTQATQESQAAKQQKWVWNACTSNTFIPKDH